MRSDDLQSAASLFANRAKSAKKWVVRAFATFKDCYDDRVDQILYEVGDSSDAPRDQLYKSATLTKFVGMAIGNIECLKHQVSVLDVHHPAIEAMDFWIESSETLAHKICDVAADVNRKPDCPITPAQLLGQLGMIIELGIAIANSSPVPADVLEESRRISGSQYSAEFPYMPIDLSASESDPPPVKTNPQILEAFKNGHPGILKADSRVTPKEFGSLFDVGDGYINSTMTALKNETGESAAELYARVMENREPNGRTFSYLLKDIYAVLKVTERLPAVSKKAANLLKNSSDS